MPPTLRNAPVEINRTSPVREEIAGVRARAAAVRAGDVTGASRVRSSRGRAGLAMFHRKTWS